MQASSGGYWKVHFDLEENTRLLSCKVIHLSAVWCWTVSIQWVYKNSFAEYGCLLKPNITLWERWDRRTQIPAVKTKDIELKLTWNAQVSPHRAARNCGFLIILCGFITPCNHFHTHRSMWSTPRRAWICQLCQVPSGSSQVADFSGQTPANTSCCSFHFLALSCIDSLSVFVLRVRSRSH